jgi:hypothetical protein
MKDIFSNIGIVCVSISIFILVFRLILLLLAFLGPIVSTLLIIGIIFMLLGEAL